VYLLHDVRNREKGRILSDLPLSGNVADISLSVCLTSSMRDDDRNVVDRRKKELLGGGRKNAQKRGLEVRGLCWEDKVGVCCLCLSRASQALRQTRSDIPSVFVGLQRKKRAVFSPNFYSYVVYTGIV
jgi:hypothetical protein